MTSIRKAKKEYRKKLMKAMSEYRNEYGMPLLTTKVERSDGQYVQIVRLLPKKVAVHHRKDGMFTADFQCEVVREFKKFYFDMLHPKFQSIYKGDNESSAERFRQIMMNMPLFEDKPFVLNI